MNIIEKLKNTSKDTNNKLDTNDKTNKDIKNIDIRNYIIILTSETVLSAWIRTTIVLFTVGITISTLSSLSKIRFIGYWLMATGLIIGSYALNDYYYRLKLLNSEKFNYSGKYNYVVLLIIILFGIFLVKILI
tara:strand:+ start:102 stop:500 length:399 start_codon:yes stop_codon:yes gene_type:complete